MSAAGIPQRSGDARPVVTHTGGNQRSANAVERLTLPESSAGQFPSGEEDSSFRSTVDRRNNPVALSAALEIEEGTPIAALSTPGSPFPGPELLAHAEGNPTDTTAPTLIAPLPPPPAIDDEEELDSVDQSKGTEAKPLSSLTLASLIGFIAGIVGLCGLGLWHQLERRHYTPRTRD